MKHSRRRFLFMFFIAFSISFVEGFAQTITTSAIAGSPFCTYTSVAVSVPYTITGTFTAGNVFTAQLSDAFGSFTAPVNIGTRVAINAGTITANIPSGTLSGIGYRIRVVASNPAIIGANNGTNLTMQLPAGNPSAFGNGSWNVSVYKGANFSTYYGSYTENNFNFSSATRWTNNTSPSLADASSGIAYSGCAIANVSTHAVSYKASNFACSQYQIDIPNNDDTGYLLINGVQVWTRSYSNALATNAWTGFLDPTTTVEFSWVNTGGNSNGALTMNLSAAGPTALAPTAGVDCASFTANWNGNMNASAYFLDVATDAAFTSILAGYNNLNVGNTSSRLVTGLTAGTQYYYRIRAFSAACSLTSNNSNVVSNQVALLSASAVTLCQGESTTMVASNATNYSWSPATGLNTTTGATVIATPSTSTVYTVTGTDALGCASYGTYTITVNMPSGNPSVFGNGAWNVHAYNGNNFNAYYGFYTENNLSFNSTTRWANNLSASSANAASGSAYAGCPNIPVDQHSVSYKRTNLACNSYQIDIAGHDDDGYLFIDGSQVWVHNGCCDAHTNVFSGFLLPSSTVEFKWREGAGASFGSVNVLTGALPITTSPTAGVSCDQFVANWNVFYNTTNYFLDVATDAAFTSMVAGYSNLNVGNVNSYLVSGLAIGPMYYYRVRAYNSTCGLLTGNSNTSTTQVTVNATTATICQGTSTVLTATNATTYSWSPATGLSATTGAVVTANPAATTTYTVTGTTTGGCVSQNTFTITVNDTIGNPSVFGNGFWNVYAYDGNNFNSYAGRYTENNLSFNSTTRWATAASASSANASSGLAYGGCPVPVDQHSVSYKRTNFVCGTYQIDITNHDDDGYLLINGVQVWVHNGCCDAHANVWTGFLSPASTVEFRWREGLSSSNGGITITNKEIVVSLAATPGPSNCNQFNANWSVASNATKYYLDVATDAAFTAMVPGYNNLDVGNVTMYLVTGLNLSTQYYYRIRAQNPVCGVTGNSNVISYTTLNVTAQPGAFTASSATVCQGQLAVAYTVAAVTGATSYTWTYSGTGATFTNGTTRNPTVDFSASATSGTISVVANNLCGSSVARTMAVTVNTTPAQPASFLTSTSSVCRPANNVAYSIAAVSGAVNYTWTYTVGAGATITGGTTTAVTINYSAASTSGNLNVKANNGACSSSLLTMSVIVNAGVPAQPSVITPSVVSPCNSAVGITYTVTNVAGVSYAWSYSGTGASITAGAGTNSITVTYASATNGTWTVTPSNICGTGSVRTLAVAFSSGATWTGATSSSWGTTTNWACGIVPSSTTDVVIPSGVTNMPSISTTATVRDLAIASTASLTNNGTLNVFGNVTNSGVISDKGTTAFVGSTAQTYTGTVTDSLKNMTLNNSLGLTVTSPLYVKQYLTLTSGNLSSGGNLTVDIYMGAILGTGTGTISGNIRVVRTLWKDNWHYISSPLSGRTFADMNDNVTIKFGVNANLYRYDETIPNPNRAIGWLAIPTVGTSIQDMTGYALYLNRWQYKTLIDFTGTYNHSQTYSNATLSNTASGTPLSDGWNLVGNPYPSEIDWDAASGWTKTGLDNAIYFWDQPNSCYATYVGGIGTNGGTRYIPCMQGFYVKVTNPGTGTLGMTNSVRSAVANRDNWRVASEEDILKLSVTTGVFKDETYVRLSEGATANFDSQLDAHKLSNSGSTPNISTKLSGLDYAVNSIPSTIMETTIIPVKLLPAITGSYTLKADITGFADAESITLEDTLLHTSQDLKVNPTYTYDLLQGDTLTRLFINYKKKVKTVDGTEGAIANSNITIYGQEQTINVLFDNQSIVANIIVYDVTGNVLYKVENKDITSGKVTIKIPGVSSGVYIVKAQTALASKTQQVFLNK